MARKIVTQTWRGLVHVVQRVTTLLVYCSFSICLEHLSKARNRDLRFTSAR